MAIAQDPSMGVGSLPGGAARSATKRARYLYDPVADFLCLGGLSFLLIPVLALLPEKELSLTFAAISMGIAHVINHPHFAFSYQIFYDGFRDKAFARGADAALRARYVFAGVVVPVMLAGFFTYSMISGDARLLGYGANLMALLVGWHYVKQGYGMLMVDAALKRQFFSAADKKVLLINSYAVWVLAWLVINTTLNTRALWGIQYYTFEVPQLLLAVGTCGAVATTVMTASVLVKNWRANGGSLPVSGVSAYLVSLYLWLLLVRWNTLWLLIVPALHSLQYLAVASRYRLNRFRDGAGADAGPRPALLRHVFPKHHQQRYAGFLVAALILGYVGFWGAPELLQSIIPYDQTVFGPTIFMFIFWVFINVHHYFLDSVMWRSQNPDVRKHLFA